MASRGRAFVAFVILGLSLFLVTGANATTYFVAKTGSDSGSCSQALPCLTVGKAYGLTQPGDIIQVSAGSYSENLMLTRSGSSTARITIQGYAVGSTCPTSASADVNSRGVRPNPSVTITGFDVRANYLVLDCFHIGSGGIDFSNASNQHHVDIAGMYVVGGIPYISSLNGGQHDITYKESYVTSSAMGFLVNACAGNCLFQDNEVERLQGGTGDVDHDYARIFGQGVTFRHNYFHGNLKSDCPGNCHIDCWQTWNIGNSGEYAHDIVIDRNYCSDSDEGIIIRDTTSSALGTYSSHYNWTVTNNVFTNNAAWNMDVEHVGNYVAENNTFVSSVVGYLFGSQAIHRNNIHYGCGFQPYGASISGDIDGQISQADHNLLYESGRTYSGFANDIKNQNPNFVSVSASPTPNYRLQSTSAAKDAGANTSPTVTVDQDGKPRPVGSTYDIGAFEYGSSSGQVIQPPTSLQAVAK